MLRRTNNFTSLRVPAERGTKQSSNSEIASPCPTNPRRCSQRRSQFCVRSVTDVTQEMFRGRGNGARPKNLTPALSKKEREVQGLYYDLDQIQSHYIFDMHGVWKHVHGLHSGDGIFFGEGF